MTGTCYWDIVEDMYSNLSEEELEERTDGYGVIVH